MLYSCGGVVGVYFLVKRCSILYLFAGNGSFAPAPYLDIHGEVDFNMRFVPCDSMQGLLLTCNPGVAVVNSFTIFELKKSGNYG